MSTLRDTAFRPYDGALTGQLTRLWVIPRYAWRELWASRLVLVVFAIGFVLPVVWGLIIYLHHNAGAIAQLNLDIGDLINIDAAFFNRLLWLQAILGFGIALLAGPPLIARDLQNNALPLYLSRPISRLEYVLSKLLVLFAPLSLITWVPGLILFGLQASLAGPGWAAANARIMYAFFVGSWVWMLVLSLFTLSISAVVRRALVARGTMMAIAFVSNGIAVWINVIFRLDQPGRTPWGLLLSPLQLIEEVWTSLFGPQAAGGLFGIPSELPTASAWAMIIFLCALFFGLLLWRTRAYEAVR